MNSRSWESSFNASVEKRDWETNCTRYGSDFGFNPYDDNWQSCFWGTASQWTTNDHSSTWNFTRISALTRMARRYKYSWKYLTHYFEVPVIVVFTKYDQFLRNVKMQVSDFPSDFPDGNVSEVAEKQFQEHYLRPLGDDVKYVQLKRRFRVMCQCYMLMFVDRNAQGRQPLRYSYWEDSWSTERRCRCVDASSCPKRQLGVER